MIVDYTGKKFGKLKAVEKIESLITPGGRAISRYLCKCECKRTIIKTGEQLRRGYSLHCGCVNASR